MGTRLLAALVVALATLLVPVSPASARAADQISMTVLDMTPLSPAITTAPRRLTLHIQLTNTTSRTLDHVVVTGERGVPLDSIAALDAAMADPKQPDPSTANPIHSTKSVQADLGPGESDIVAVITSTGTGAEPGAPNICLCTPAGVYPLYFTASVDGTVLGATQTYLSAFDTRPTATRVGWIWPLIDRPHRVLSDTIFTDDALTSSIDAGGRLDRALRAVEFAVQDEPELALTLVADPELLDELAVMASGTYTVAAPGAAAVPGTGTAAAQGWLARLRALLDEDPHLELVFTPYADPDLASLTGAHLQWSAQPPPAMQARLSVALGTRLPTTTLAWPQSGAISTRTAAELARTGPHTVLVDATTIPAGSRPASGAALGVSTRRGTVRALPVDADITTQVDSAVSTDGTGAAALPRLAAELAIRIAADVKQDNTDVHRFVLVPPRDVDADPTAAAAAMVATTEQFWTRPAGLASLRYTTELHTIRAAALIARPASATSRLSSTVLTYLQNATNQGIPLVTALLADDTNPLLQQFAGALQRAESTAWTHDTAGGITAARALVNAIAAVKLGVKIVKPSSGAYTLASSDSRLPLTVENDLDYPVTVTVTLQAVHDLPGFSAQAKTETIAAHSKAAFGMRTKINNPGRIQVQAELLTTTGVQIGAATPLSVRSTALGVVGLIITIVAAVVLVLALIRRFWLRYGRKPRAEITPDQPVTPEPATT